MNHSKIFKNIAWGFLLITFHITINQLDLLPDWLGYLLLFMAVKEMGSTLNDLKNLEISILIFLVYESLNWIFTLFGSPLNIPIITLLLNVLSIYIDYMILTNVIKLCIECGNHDEGEMTKLRDRYFVIDILCTVLLFMNYLFLNEFISIIILIISIMNIVLRVLISIKLFQLS